MWVKLQFKVALPSKTTSCFYHWWNPLGVTTNFNTNKYPATCSKEDCFDCLIDLTNKHVLAIWYSFLSFITQCFCHFHRKSTPREHLNSIISSSRTCLRGNEDSSVGVLMEIESLFSSNIYIFRQSELSNVLHLEEHTAEEEIGWILIKTLTVWIVKI